MMRTTTWNPSVALMSGRYSPKRIDRLPAASTPAKAPTSARLIGIACQSAARSGSAVEDRDGAGPAGRGTADLDRKAADREAVGGQRFEIVQLFEVAIADLAPRLVPFPDQPGIASRGVFLLGMDKRRIPAPAVGAGQPDAAFKQIERRLAANAAAGRDIIRLAVGRAGAGVDDDDLQWLQHVPDA